MTSDQLAPQSGEMVAERRVSPRSFLAHYAVAAVAGVVLLVLGFVISGWLWLAVPLPWLAVWAYARLVRIGTSYRLFQERIEIDSGILSRSIENVELFRVRDVGLRQGLLGRIGNYGDVYLHSTDSTTPDLHIRSIDAPKEFYELLRSQVSASRAQHRTLIVEEGQTVPEP